MVFDLSLVMNREKKKRKYIMLTFICLHKNQCFFHYFLSNTTTVSSFPLNIFKICFDFCITIFVINYVYFVLYLIWSIPLLRKTNFLTFSFILFWIFMFFCIFLCKVYELMFNYFLKFQRFSSNISILVLLRNWNTLKSQ